MWVCFLTIYLQYTRDMKTIEFIGMGFFQLLQLTLISFFKILCPFADQKINHILFFCQKFFRVEQSVNSNDACIYATSYEDIIEHMRFLQHFQNEDKTVFRTGCSKKILFFFRIYSLSNSYKSTFLRFYSLSGGIIPSCKCSFHSLLGCFLGSLATQKTKKEISCAIKKLNFDKFKSFCCLFISSFY